MSVNAGDKGKAKQWQKVCRSGVVYDQLSMQN